MIHDGTQDQHLYNEQKGLPADAEALPGKAGEIVPAPPRGDGWVAEAVTAVEASITKLIDEFRVQPFITALSTRCTSASCSCSANGSTSGAGTR
jgi:hypothetical protein